MTREEAITQLEILLEYCESMMTSEYPVWRRDCEALQMLIAALRPVSREQVENVWRGEWIWNTSGLYPKPVCSKCGEEPYRRSNHTSDLPNYCPKCGRPMTDEAVEMVMERLEALYETT